MNSNNARGFVAASTLVQACGAAVGLGVCAGVWAQCPATFAPVNAQPMGSPFTVVVGDFNHDGKKDLASANFGGANVTFRFADPNQPAGTAWLAPVNVAMGLNPRGAGVADFNHDGIDDLALGYNGGGPSGTRLAIVLSNGNGTFQEPGLYPIPTQPYVLRIADINHDGNPDVGVYGSGSVSILLGNANGTFQPYTTGAAQASVNDFVFADLNGDGALDLAMSNYNANADSFVATALGLAPTGAAFGPVVNTAIGSYGAYGLARGDFNGDGRDDLVLGHSITNHRLQVLLTNPDGSLAPQQFVSSIGAGPVAAATADFNGDGRTDVAAVARTSNLVVVYMGRGDGTLTAGATFAVTQAPNSIVIADMNNDGRPDIVTGDQNSGNASILMNTTATFAFTTHPAGKSVCPGGLSGATFFAAAATNVPGGITAYRWERLVGSTWTTIPAGSGAGIGEVSFDTNSQTMFVINIPGNPGDLVAKLRSVATNACGTTPSNVAELRIINPCGPADIGAQGGIASPCGDGILDNNDFIVFIEYFFTTNVLADRGQQGGIPGADGLFDNNDFVIFIDQFFSGCVH